MIKKAIKTMVLISMLVLHCDTVIGRNFTMKKTPYFIAIFIVSIALTLFYGLFFNTKPATPNHANLNLTPFTAQEQKDLIKIQEHETHVDIVGPLHAKMDAQTAQAKVLNLRIVHELTPATGISILSPS